MVASKRNTLYYGDNLDILQRYVKSESVDLIYLDPPFNSDKDYNAIFKEETGDSAAAQIHAFEDTWHWDETAVEQYELLLSRADRVADSIRSFHSFLGGSQLMAYLVMMAPRLVELHRVLSKDGKIFLHCDPKASHYLKLLMDGVFGPENFRNEIIWHYKFRMMHSARIFSRKHDVILFYAKSKTAVIDTHAVAEEWTREEIVATRKQEIHEDKNGREWIWMPGGKGNSKNKKKFLDEIIKEGKARDDVWDIAVISSSAKERLGYPTQKPEALLEVIIKAASEKGQTVLDPFCGCGTAVAVAHRLKRKWIGIDITHIAVKLIQKRLKDAHRIERDKDYDVVGEPVDLSGARELAKHNKWQFQWWALGLVDARPVDQKKGADRGIDGRRFFLEGKERRTEQILFSVKGGTTGVRDVRDLRGTIEREKAAIGVFICLAAPTRDMKREAADSGFYQSPWANTKHPRLQIITIEELLAGKALSLPPLALRGYGDTTFKKAPKQVGCDDENGELEFS